MRYKKLLDFRHGKIQIMKREWKLATERSLLKLNTRRMREVKIEMGKFC